ncbi:hypothetical protein [Microvirga sesbaniae]|uniref:hypothetical protein n=1 Tax=Microvirga sesbaniae TaxID=681392 RepID=UPI0021C5BE3A|nr:hypothetical protein [Microvirga sp. HBU67692]
MATVLEPEDTAMIMAAAGKREMVARVTVARATAAGVEAAEATEIAVAAARAA